MSRHEIPAKNPAHKIIVGWDHPLLTFFVQVIDKEKENKSDDYMVFWRGTNIQEIYEIEELAAIVRPYAILSAEIRSTLYGDKDDGK